jgi:hypothetical protein
VEDSIEQFEVGETSAAEDEIELDLGTDTPIIVGKRSLAELATLSLTIAEDMSS